MKQPRLTSKEKFHLLRISNPEPVAIWAVDGKKPCLHPEFSIRGDVLFYHDTGIVWRRHTVLAPLPPHFIPELEVHFLLDTLRGALNRVWKTIDAPVLVHHEDLDHMHRLNLDAFRKAPEAFDMRFTGAHHEYCAHFGLIE